MTPTKNCSRVSLVLFSTVGALFVAVVASFTISALSSANASDAADDNEHGADWVTPARATPEEECLAENRAVGKDVKNAFDHANGSLVSLPVEQWCAELGDLVAPDAVVQRAGLNSVITLYDGHVRVQYHNVEVSIVDGPEGPAEQHLVAQNPVPEAEAQARLAEAERVAG